MYITRWTNKTPTEIGWYWRKIIYDPFGYGEEIVYVREYEDKLCIMNGAIPTEGYLWAGPLSSPKPLKEE